MPATVADWSDYRYFLEIAKAGSLSAAARRLRVNQSTVGRRLAALESHLGTRLFDRTPDGYVLTAAGESVRADVERIDDGFLAVARRLAGRDARIEGSVRVAIAETFANRFLIPRLAALRARHPALCIELLTGNAPVDLARSEADLAVRLGLAPKQPTLVVRRAGVAGYALYAAPAYLARHGRPRLRDGARDGLAGHDVVAFGAELADAPVSRWLREHAHRASVTLRANSVASVHEAVVAGLGLGVLPCIFSGDTLTRLSAPLGTTPIFTIVHEDMMRNARVRAVLTFLAELLHRERRLLAGA